MTQTAKNSIIAGLVFGLLMSAWFAVSPVVLGWLGIVTPTPFPIVSHVISGMISGVLFGTGCYLFVTSKTFKKQTQITLADGETVIYSNGVNHLKNGEAVGGKLYLLADRLQFRSHKFNLQNHELIIELPKIKEVLFYNIWGLIPRGLVVVLANGTKEKFVVDNRRQWKSQIETILSPR